MACNYWPTHANSYYFFYLLQKTESDKPKESEEATDKDTKDKKAEGKDETGEKKEDKKDGETVAILWREK